MQRPRPGAADPGELPARFFRALYQAYDLHQVEGIHVAVPTGTPCFAGRSLGALARQISQHHDPARQGSRPAPPAGITP